MIGVELLDDPHADPSAVRHALRDIARLNALFGGTHAVVRELEPLFERRERETGNGKQETWTLLDVGAGSGDIARAAVLAARRHGVTLRPVGVELSRTAAHEHSIREFRLTSKGMQVGQPLTDFEGVLTGVPAYRGKEIEEDTFEANAQTIFDQAENRLHVQKAVLEWTVS